MAITVFHLLYQLTSLMNKVYFNIDSGELNLDDVVSLKQREDKIQVSKGHWTIAEVKKS